MDWESGEQVLIEPRRGRGEDLLPPLACMVCVPEDLIYITRSSSRLFVSKRKIFISDCYCSSEHGFSLLGPVLGAPQAVLVLEKAVALGVKDFIVIGWCGSLQPDVKIGDYIVPTGYFSEEGTSSHYPLSGTGGSIPESPGIFESLLSRLKGCGARIHKGRVWTTDSPYRETVSKVVFYNKRNVLGVDMETSALLRVAAYRNVSMGIILTVSDTLHTLKWRPGLRNPEFKSSRELLLNVIIDELTVNSGRG